MVRFHRLLQLLFLCLLCTIAKVPAEECSTPQPERESMRYLKFGGAWHGSGTDYLIGIGSRATCGHWGLDLSVQFWHSHFIIGPRLQALYLFWPYRLTTPYVGFGAGYGWIRTNKGRFSGFTAEVTAGYAFFRSKCVSLFVEATLSQPAFRLSDRASSYRPVGTLGFGIGF